MNPSSPPEVVTPPESTQSSLRESLDSLVSLLSPHFSECFSEETKSLRNALLGLGLALFMLGSGAIEIAAEASSFAGVKLIPKAKTVLALAGGFIALFFAIVYVIRCYVEWSAWRLKTVPAAWGIQEFHEELMEAENSRIAESQRIASEVRARYEAGERSEALNQRSTELGQLFTSTDAIQQKVLSDIFLSYVRRAVSVRQFRLVLEAAFPTVFSIAAALFLIWSVQ